MSNHKDQPIEKIPVLEIFNNAKYVVPIYQRNYAWDSDQITQLLDDVRGRAKQDLSDYDNTCETDTSEYHLGLLVVNEIEDGVYEVIDGQQRLTTLYLIYTFLNRELPYQVVPKMELEYEARDIYVSSLKNPSLNPEENNGVATEIYNGYSSICNYFRNIGSEGEKHIKVLESFRNDLLSVNLIRVQVPLNIDLNHYFEIMNTRGEQLEPHQIAKAYLLQNLTETDQLLGSRIWEACSNMDSYINKNFEKDLSEFLFKNPEKSMELKYDSPGDLFCNFLQSKALSKVSNINITNNNNKVYAEGSNETSNYLKYSKTLKQIIEEKTKYNIKTENSSHDHRAVSSILSFPNFLLQVNAVLNYDTINNKSTVDPDSDDDPSLDDKNLLNILSSNWTRNKNEDKKKDNTTLEFKAKTFLTTLLLCRAIFDTVILKRSKDNEKWELKNPFWNVSDKSDEAFSSPKSSQLKNLQAALRITYTSPKTMHWVTEVLHSVIKNNRASPSSLIEILERYCCIKINDSQFQSKQGFEIKRIVFTYLDYLLIYKRQATIPLQIDKDWEFQFRTSIEHFFPRNPDNGKPWANEDVNMLGNLALVTRGLNSHFSNAMPVTKAQNYGDIVRQSPKLQIMANIALAEGNWTEKDAKEHGKQMTNILQHDLVQFGFYPIAPRLAFQGTYL